MLLLLAPTAFSQTTGLNSKGDTIICNTIGQYRFWQQSYFKSRELQQLLDVSELARLKLAQAEYKDSLAIVEYVKSLDAKKEELRLTNIKVDGLNKTIVDQDKEITRQKIYTWLAIVGAGAATSFIGYKYITK